LVLLLRYPLLLFATWGVVLVETDLDRTDRTDKVILF
jgi:hypothetical protein